jgi:hypothetical protein
MIYKLLSGLNGLVVVTSCATDGVASALLLVPIFTHMKLGDSYLKLGETV